MTFSSPVKGPDMRHVQAIAAKQDFISLLFRESMENPCCWWSWIYQDHHGIFKVWISMLWHPLAWFPLLLFSFRLLILEISVLVQANHLLRGSERTGIREYKEISSYPRHCTQTGLTLNSWILSPLCSSWWCGLEYTWSFCLVDNNVVWMNQI